MDNKEKYREQMQSLNDKVADYEDSLYHLKKEIDTLDEAIAGPGARQIKENMYQTLNKLEKTVNEKIDNKKNSIKKEYLDKEIKDE